VPLDSIIMSTGESVGNNNKAVVSGA
jgi:hypothetical protein